MEQKKIEYCNSLHFDNVIRQSCRHKIKMQEDTLQVLRDYLQNKHMEERGRLNIHCVGLYYSNCIRIFFMCFLCKRGSLVLILRIPAYLGIKGDHFFRLKDFLWPFYVQIGVLQFVLRVQFNAKLNVMNLYVTNLY
jgi:hypothetical protein